MNTLQLAPLGVKAPSGPTGVNPVAEASSTPAKAPPKAKISPLPAAATHAEQQQRLAEARANTARAAAERKAQAEAASSETESAPVDTLDRKVGLVEGTLKVFVDLVKPPGDQAVFRVFGPSDNPAPPRTSAAASNAYTRGPAVALKDLGTA